MLTLPDPIDTADIAVFGGSGFYELLTDARSVPIDTPYGPPSEPPLVGTFGDRRVAFIPRHGVDHRMPAHMVNYRANIWAMAALRVRAIIAPFACGALRADLEQGDLMVVDQQVDRTHSRHGTFFDGPVTIHTAFADPYDPGLSAALADAAERCGVRVHRGGTVVVIPGPRFSTRAESASYQAAGWDLVNMTQAPEAALAAEAGIPFVGLGLVTDHDVGVRDDPDRPPVTADEVFAVLHRLADTVREVLAAALPALPLAETH